MSRSTKKGPYVQPVLLKRVIEMNEAGEKRILKTWSRSSTIFPEFVGHTFAVHDGRKQPKIWLVTSSVSLLRQEHSKVTQDQRQANKRKESIADGSKGKCKICSYFTPQG